jgi:hypothetical protein
MQIQTALDRLLEWMDLQGWKIVMRGAYCNEVDVTVLNALKTEFLLNNI